MSSLRASLASKCYACGFASRCRRIYRIASMGRTATPRSGRGRVRASSCPSFPSRHTQHHREPPFAWLCETVCAPHQGRTLLSTTTTLTTPFERSPRDTPACCNFASARAQMTPGKEIRRERDEPRCSASKSVHHHRKTCRRYSTVSKLTTYNQPVPASGHASGRASGRASGHASGTESVRASDTPAHCTRARQPCSGTLDRHDAAV